MTKRAPTLHELQTEMHRVLRGERDVADLAAAWGVATERLAIYRDFVQGHAHTAIDKIYPCLARVLHDAWAEIAAAYVEATAPSHYELNEAARQLPAFLAAHVERWHLSPAHLELAELEWLDWEIWSDRRQDPPSLPLSCLDTDEWAKLRLRPIDAMAVVEPRYRTHLVLAAVAAGATAELAQAEDAPCPVIVYRHPRTLRSAVRAMDDLDRFALAAAAQALTLQAMALASGRPRHELQPMITTAIERGIVVLAGHERLR